MLHFILDFATLIFIKLPIAFLLIWFLAGMGHSFFGGPVWLWMIGISIFAVIYLKEEFDKAKTKEEQELN